MADDWTQDHRAKGWIAHVLEDMAPKMRESSMVAQLVPDDPTGDVKFWVELGASIMMDKPIVSIVTEGREIPEKLKLIADEIVYIGDPPTDEDGKKMEAAYERVAVKYGLD